MESVRDYSSVLISGAGQLGARYLQGLAGTKSFLNIFVHDIDLSSLERARLRWTELETRDTLHRVVFTSSLESVPEALDLVIVATTASVRPRVVCEICCHSQVRFWILEKILAQSAAGLDAIVERIGANGKAWVNTPRRMLPWHHQIKDHLDTRSPMTMAVHGGFWGLATNSIHFLDLFSMWTGEALVSIDTVGLESAWFEAKRAGNWEILGSISARFSAGSSMTLVAHEGEVFYEFELKDALHSWKMVEQLGIARRSDGLDIPGRIPFQSEVSGPLVDSILKSGECELPSLAQSSTMHRIFINGMLQHWRETMDSSASSIPIT